MREPAELGTPSTQNRSLTATGGSSPGSSGVSVATHREAASSSAAARRRPDAKTSAPETSPLPISSACWAAVRWSRSLTRGRSRAARARHSEAALGDVGSARERLLAREAGARLVLAQHVLKLDDVRSGLDLVEFELVHLLDVLEDLGQLAGHALELLVRDPETREASDVE